MTWILRKGKLKGNVKVSVQIKGSAKKLAVWLRARPPWCAAKTWKSQPLGPSVGRREAPKKPPGLHANSHPGRNLQQHTDTLAKGAKESRSEGTISLGLVHSEGRQGMKACEHGHEHRTS